MGKILILLALTGLTVGCASVHRNTDGRLEVDGTMLGPQGTQRVIYAAERYRAVEVSEGIGHSALQRGVPAVIYGPDGMPIASFGAIVDGVYVPGTHGSYGGYNAGGSMYQGHYGQPADQVSGVVNHYYTTTLQRYIQSGDNP
jgi:hypothetical protein